VLADRWAETLGWDVEPSDEDFIREIVAKGFAAEDDTKVDGEQADGQPRRTTGRWYGRKARPSATPKGCSGRRASCSRPSRRGNVMNQEPFSLTGRFVDVA
jgi:hypothetical protein